MTGSIASLGPQADTLRAYTVLHALPPKSVNRRWSGALILNLYLDPIGAALSRASHVAGAVCLTLEPSPDRLRSALRTGACDFVVKSLDEAVRATKNEVRQRRPLSVGLEGDPLRMLNEVVDRGIAPQLFAAPEIFPSVTAELHAFGASLVSLQAPAGEPHSAEQILEHHVTGLSWGLHTTSVSSGAELRAFDDAASGILPVEDELRRHWLEVAPRLFPRELRRVLWLTPAERDALGCWSPSKLDTRMK